MFAAAAEESGRDLHNGRGDAYCGMLNASYNLALRSVKAYIPSYPVGTADEVADMVSDFLPVARILIGLKKFKNLLFRPPSLRLYRLQRSHPALLPAWHQCAGKF